MSHFPLRHPAEPEPTGMPMAAGTPARGDTFPASTLPEPAKFVPPAAQPWWVRWWWWLAVTVGATKARTPTEYHLAGLARSLERRLAAVEGERDAAREQVAKAAFDHQEDARDWADEEEAYKEQITALKKQHQRELEAARREAEFRERVLRAEVDAEREEKRLLALVVERDRARVASEIAAAVRQDIDARTGR